MAYNQRVELEKLKSRLEEDWKKVGSHLKAKPRDEITEQEKRALQKIDASLTNVKEQLVKLEQREMKALIAEYGGKNEY